MSYSTAIKRTPLVRLLRYWLALPQVATSLFNRHQHKYFRAVSFNIRTNVDLGHIFGIAGKPHLAPA
jgi:hypothetical protein